jgi:chromate transport protein ChrA
VSGAGAGGPATGWASLLLRPAVSVFIAAWLLQAAVGMVRSVWSWLVGLAVVVAALVMAWRWSRARSQRW